MADLVLNAEMGRPLGSSASRRLRKEHKVPGVVYGMGADPVAISVVYGELRQTLSTDAGLNAIISLQVDGESHLSIVKELQRHPVRDEVIHVDFLRVDRTQKLVVDVPISLEGEAKKVTDEDGMVDQTMFSLEVHAAPGNIPNEFTVDITDLEIGTPIRVGDIRLPAGVTTEVDPEEPVVIGTVTRSTIEAMAADEAEAEAGDEAGAEADAADGDAEDAPGGDE